MYSEQHLDGAAAHRVTTEFVIAQSRIMHANTACLSTMDHCTETCCICMHLIGLDYSQEVNKFLKTMLIPFSEGPFKFIFIADGQFWGIMVCLLGDDSSS